MSACSRGSSLRPPCPAGRSLPPSPSPLPGGPGAGTPRPSRRRWRRRLAGEPWAPRRGTIGSPASPAPAGRCWARFPRSHALSKLCRRSGQAFGARPASGREGRRAGPGRARGSERSGPGPWPHHAPARWWPRRRRRRGRRWLRSRGNRWRGRPGSERRADPLPGRGGRRARAEQRQRFGTAGPGRGQVVPGQRVGESEQQLGLGGKGTPGRAGSAPGQPRVRLPLTRPRLCVSSAGGEAPAARPGRFPEAARLFR